MNEETPMESNESPESEAEQRLQEFRELLQELHESGEVFPFPGIKPEALASLQAVDAEFPGYTTPIDELLVRFEEEGMKILPGDNPDSRDVFIVPAGSDDAGMDSVLPRDLENVETLDERLQRLFDRIGPKK